MKNRWAELSHRYLWDRVRLHRETARWAKLEITGELTPEAEAAARAAIEEYGLDDLHLEDLVASRLTVPNG